MVMFFGAACLCREIRYIPKNVHSSRFYTTIGLIFQCLLCGGDKKGVSLNGDVFRRCVFMQGN